MAEVYLGDLMEEEAEDAPADPSAEPVPMTREELAPLAGVYRGEAPNQILQLGLSGDTLRLGDGPPLRPIGDYRFLVGDPGVLLKFEVEGDGSRVVLEHPSGRFERADAWEPTSRELREFTGTFHSEELGTDYRFAIEADTLWFHHRKLDSARLAPTFKDGFLYRGASLEFTRDAGGTVNGFRLSDGRVWNVRFVRVPG